MMRSTSLFTVILLSLTLFSAGASQVHLSKEEALRIYLGDSAERKTIFLTTEQVRAIQSKAKTKVESKIVTYYVSQRGVAFFENRTVRTMPATFIIVIDHSGTVRGVEMLAFFEPEDYLPPKRWLKTFFNKTIDDDLWLKRGVYNISGATLSAQAITESVRKYLVTYDLVINKDLP